MSDKPTVNYIKTLIEDYPSLVIEHIEIENFAETTRYKLTWKIDKTVDTKNKKVDF